MEKMKRKERNSNIELFRVVVMFSIVCHHYVVNSGLLEILPLHQTSANSLFYYLFGMWGKCGIDCFVMITGYFMCTMKITLRKFLKLYLQVVFYGLVFYLAFCLMGKAACSVREVVLTLLPFRIVEDDSFVSAYMVWWLFIPFLNAMVRGLSARQHLALTALCCTVFMLYPWTPYTRLALNPICWFSTIFFIGSFIRLHAGWIDARLHAASPAGTCRLLGGGTGGKRAVVDGERGRHCVLV